jgi:hypothetical protein
MFNIPEGQNLDCSTCLTGYEIPQLLRNLRVKEQGAHWTEILKDVEKEEEDQK